MKKTTGAASILGLMCVFLVGYAQEDDDVAADELMPFDEEEIAVLEDADDKASDDALGQISVTVFRNADYGGYSKTFYASQGARIDLKPKCGKLNNKISSIVIRGPRGTSATVYDKSLCYNCSTHSGTFWAYNEKSSVNQRTLKWLGVHDRITRIYLQFDGYLVNGEVHTPSC